MTNFPERPPKEDEIESNPDILKQVDERISYDQVKKVWLFETNIDGIQTEFEYDFNVNEWKKIDHNEEKDDLDDSKISGMKRSAHDDKDNDEEEENKKSIKRLKKEKMEQLKEEIKRLQNEKNSINSLNKNGESIKNTGVFISKLPSDTTKEEVIEAFSKYGLISEDYKTGEPRVKLYYENGVFKGEALVVYHSIESVLLAIQMLDESNFRPGDSEKIRVQQAEFSNKGSSTEKKSLSSEERQLLQNRKEEMKKKLSNWEGENKTIDTENKVSEIKRKIFEKIVIIRHVFRKEELEKDPLLELDLKEDIQEECDRHEIGKDITKIILYDISECFMVKFNKAALSLKCVEVLNGRYFDGLKLDVKLYNGEKLEKSRSTDENEEDRLNQFGNWIEKH